jgi:hypothetical protein
MAPLQAMQVFIDANANNLLERLKFLMLVLYPECDKTSLSETIVDYVGVTDNQLVMIAGDMALVEVMIRFLNALFITPSVLFGGPSVYFGTDIFLAIRLSFRICGSVCAGSQVAANELYDNLIWVTHQVGLGRFKAAEALVAVMLNWENLAANVIVDHKEFLTHMWKIIVAAAQKEGAAGELSANGDHCKLLAATCMKRGAPINRN